MRYRSGSEHGPEREAEGRDVELLWVRRTQRLTGDEGRIVRARSRRRGGRGRRRPRAQAEVAKPKRSVWAWLTSLFKSRRREPSREQSLGAQEARVLAEFCRAYGTPFRDLTLLKLALTHRSYLSVTGQGPRESNERLEFLGDSVLGLVTSEFLYRRAPDEHEGQLTKTKSLLVSKAILSRRALRMGLGRFVLMSHSEVESGGRQRLSILADAFESVIGAVYLDQGFEASRAFIHRHLLAESDAITSDKRHTNYKSHLQEYVQNSFRTHPVYRIRSEFGPDHSKHFMVEVMVGKRTLGEGRGHNKKEAEQAAARDALEKVERVRRTVRDDEDEDDEAAERVSAREPQRESTRESHRERGGRGEAAPSARGRGPAPAPVPTPEPPARDEDDDDEDDDESPSGRRRRRSRRGGRGRHVGTRDTEPSRPPRAAASPAPESLADEDDDDALDARERLEPLEPLERDRGRSEERGRDRDDDFESPRLAVPAERSPLPPLSPADEELAERAPVPREPEPARGDVSRPSFGRGRRREPAPGAVVPSTEPAESRRVDPYAQVDAPAPTPPPVVDVTPSEPEAEPETEAEREARIEEMERALDNFGRRRSPDYGRRGRRR